MPSLHPSLFLLALVSFFILLSWLPAFASISTHDNAHTTPVLPLARTPLIMLSTMDGTLAAFDARSGAQLFTHQDSRPAVDSWAAPGVPDYVPSLDGLLYRIDRATDEVHVIDGKFISTLSNPFSPTVSRSDQADAVILTAEESSVMYVDLRTGKVLQQLKYSDTAPTDPLLPRMSDHLIAVSRTTVGVRVVQIGSNRELANASLVHTVPSYLDRGRCLPNSSPPSDAFVAYVTKSRNRITVRSMTTGDVVWTKELSSPVVEAHGLGGVQVAGNRREAELAASSERALPDPAPVDITLPDPAPRDVIVTTQGKYMYAMLAAPDDEDDSDKNVSDSDIYVGDDDRKRPPKSIKRYHVNSARDPSSIPHSDRLLAINRGRGKSAPNDDNTNDDTYNNTSRDVGLAMLALFVVGFVGYVAGSRPRVRTPKPAARKRIKRRRRTNPITGIEESEDPRAFAQQMAATGDEDEASTDSGLEDHPAEQRPEREARPQFVSEKLLELSTGSTGSSAGGYVSNRTESGWMSVGRLRVYLSKELGVGSHGTMVYEGIMVPGDRRVAVKRLLRPFFESAKKEISLLIELDEASPHVVRYFAMEEDSEFIYLALELCASSLAERVTERLAPVPPKTYIGGPPPWYTFNALRQLLLGLSDLHKAGVVHRDVKPQNVLITRKPDGGVGDVKLADVGLALRLAANRSSYTAVTNAGGGVGTTGWRAPEVLNGGRQTKAVDIFAAGCVVSFVLTGGFHPFGNPIFGRDGNIVAGKPSLEPLEALNLPEACDIVKKMIDSDASTRPTAKEALEHPFFWTDAKKLSFLVDISDRLYDLRHDFVRYTENLDVYEKARCHCSDWWVRMDMELLMGLGGRGYENTASGLLRVIRNKRNHYSELPASLRKRLGPLPDEKSRPVSTDGKGMSEGNTVPEDMGCNFLTYFTSRVPHLLMCMYQYAIENPALIAQPHFLRYGLKAITPQMPRHSFSRKGRPAGLAAGTPSGFETSTRSSDLQPGPFNRYVDGTESADQYAGSDVDQGDDCYVNGRRTYHRHDLVTIQLLCEEMHDDARRRAIAFDILQPSAFKRYAKRLKSNEFDEDDYDTPMERPSNSEDEDSDGGFHKVTPKRYGQLGASGFGARNTTSSVTPGASRPPGFGPLRPGMTGSITHNGPHYRRNTNGQPTASPWSGNEDRVLDFANMRNRKTSG